MKVTSSDKYSYTGSGVDIKAGNQLIKVFNEFSKRTFSKGRMDEIGGFGSIFDLKKENFIDPILVSACDGVGTKLLLANQLNYYKTVGIDLVAMSVNDLLAQGATPLFFLDYIATEKIDVKVIKDVVAGIVEGCQKSEIALIGGETAEMPGMYHSGHIDLAGFALGAVERKNLLPSKNIREKDKLIGLSSNGIHSNGYSLIRSIIEGENCDLEGPAPFFPQNSLGKELMKPTRIYVKQVMHLINKGLIKGIAHITGGGILENLPRILPKSKGAIIEADLIGFDFKSKIFKWISEISGISNKEMLKTFNCGIGMILVVSSRNTQIVEDIFKKCGEEVKIIGEINNTPGVKINNIEKLWKN